MRDKKKGGGLMKIVDALGKAEKKRAVAQTIVAATGLGLASVIGMLTLLPNYAGGQVLSDYERPAATRRIVFHVERRRVKRVLLRSEFG